MNKKRIKAIICGTLVVGIISGICITPAGAIENELDSKVIMSEYGEVRKGTLDNNFQGSEFSNVSDSYARIEEVNTSIAMSATISTTINSKKDLNDALENNKIGAAVLLIDENLNVIDSNNNVIESLEEIYNEMESRTMPILKVADKNVITPLANFINNKNIEDVYILSTNNEIVREIRNLCPITRAIIDFNINSSGDLKNEELMKIVGDTNKSGAKVALLPEELLTRDNVEFLQKKLITVWGVSKGDKISAHNVITSGVNGILSENPEEVINSLESYNGNNTIIRHQFIIGHRGIPSLAPENTISGYKKAYELGADVLETDIYLTKDNEIVIMHDGTLDRTTTGSGNVEDYTMAELKEFYANGQFSQEYPEERIPSLEEMMDEFKGKDVDIFIEIKSYKPEIVNVLVDLIKEKNMEDQISIITFSDAQAKLMREALPEMSVGYLTSAGNNGKPYDYLRNTLQMIQPMGTTFNTSYMMLNKEYLNIAKQRGLTMWPWTYRKEEDLSKHFTMGIHGLTTDYTQWISNKEVRLDSEKEEYVIKVNESETVNAITTNYQGNNNSVLGEFIVLQGEDYIEIVNNEIEGISEGEAYIQIKYTCDMLGKPYDIYTNPIKVTVESEDEIVVSKINNLRVEDKEQSSLTLLWESPKETVGLVEYIIYKDGKKIANIPSSSISYKVDNLRINTNYGFKVTAKYSNNIESKPVSINIRTGK